MTAGLLNGRPSKLLKSTFAIPAKSRTDNSKRSNNIIKSNIQLVTQNVAFPQFRANDIKITSDNQLALDNNSSFYQYILITTVVRTKKKYVKTSSNVKGSFQF